MNLSGSKHAYVNLSGSKHACVNLSSSQNAYQRSKHSKTQQKRGINGKPWLRQLRSTETLSYDSQNPWKTVVTTAKINGKT